MILPFEVESVVTPDLGDKGLFEEFGCLVDSNGIFKSTTDGGAFKYYQDEQQYAKLCQNLQVHVQTILKEVYHLEEKWIPKFSSEGDPRCNIFLSSDVLTNSNLLLLVPGKNVRAGFWSQRYSFEHGLKMGTMIPYIQRALELGWAIATFNPNWNYWKPQPDSTKVPGSETPAIHMASVWNTYLSRSKATKICVLAHSKGGEYTEELFSGSARYFLPKIRAFAFTDATFSSNIKNITDVKQAFCEKGRSWVCSVQEPTLNTFIRVEAVGIDNYSAGTTVQEETTGMAFKPNWDFFLEKMK